MSSPRHLSALDRLIVNLDQAVRTLLPGAARAERASPAFSAAESELSDTERKHVAGLMRINHTGEVCAQALYQGQALTAKLSGVRDTMEQAAREEIDHLAWCEQRLRELDSHTSVLVSAHLENHLQTLPAHEQKSRVILEQMLIDEKQHGTVALEAGGAEFPRWLKGAMTSVSRAMTKSTYYI